LMQGSDLLADLIQSLFFFLDAGDGHGVSFYPIILH
jgi:hypothetical protein